MKSIEESPINRLVIRATAFTAGGMFCDGYILGNIGIALGIAGPQLGMSNWMIGFIGAAALAGIFFGSPLAGWISDRHGRRRVFTANLAILLAASLLQLFVTDSIQLAILRIIVGMSIGAEYSIGAAYLSEVSPRKQRGALLGSLNAAWILGFAGSYFVGALLRSRDVSWKIILASAAIPVILVMIARIGAPESPRWLISKGRYDEADAIIRDHWGNEYGVDVLKDSNVKKRRFTSLFAKGYRQRTVFAGLFWCCQSLPLFALTIFLDRVLSIMKVDEEIKGALMMNFLYIVGAAMGIYFLKAMPRRTMVIGSFAIMTVLLLALSASDHLPGIAVMIVFAAFVTIGHSATNLQYVYPSEIFPTEVRSSGVGVAAAISRIGAAVSTFLLPAALDQLGISVTMIILAAVTLVGFTISVAWAPETRNLDLHAAGSVPNRETKTAKNAAPIVNC